jgi:hypothetical protein
MPNEIRKRRLQAVSQPLIAGKDAYRYNNNSSVLKSKGIEVKAKRPKRIRNYRPLNYFTQ